jgi:hypothetical protein
MKTNEYRTEFHIPFRTHPYTPDSQRGFLLNMDDRKENRQALDMPPSYTGSLISVVNWGWKDGT